MYFKNLSISRERPVFLLETLQFLEERFGVVITIHDCFGKLSGPDGERTLDPYLRHRHPFCRCMRKESSSCNAACIKDCLFHAESYARKQNFPFFHRCWKGGWELIVPIQQNGVLEFLFYAGVFRRKAEKPPEIPEPVRKLYRSLPIRDLNELEKLAYLLTGFGLSLLQYSSAKRQEPEYDRHTMLRQKIRNYLSNHIHEPIHLKDLADELCLSETRTSHLVKRLFSVPFQTMVAEERINQALNLLRNPELPLKVIAEKTGFQNEYYFSRVFRSRCGSPPGRFRKTQGGLEAGAERGQGKGPPVGKIGP